MYSVNLSVSPYLTEVIMFIKKSSKRGYPTYRW